MMNIDSEEDYHEIPSQEAQDALVNPCQSPGQFVDEKKTQK